MRKESATIRKCHSRLSSLGLDSTVAFHKSKLILKIYRDVVWVLSERAQELQEYAWELGDQDLSTGLCYLENFAPDIDLQDFEEKVCCVIQSQMLVDVITVSYTHLDVYKRQQTFNKMGFIETEERDEIYMALRGILDALPDGTLQKDALMEKFEQLRDF